jgi:hypothetical protein
MWNANGSQLYYVQREGNDILLLSINPTTSIITQPVLKARQSREKLPWFEELPLYNGVGSWQELLAKILRNKVSDTNKIFTKRKDFLAAKMDDQVEWVVLYK